MGLDVSKIKPALTADSLVSDIDKHAEPHVVLPEGITRIGLAAFCLHKQPFGFTREDVEVLTDAVGSVYSSMEGSAKLLSIADRIEALPPTY